MNLPFDPVHERPVQKASTEGDLVIAALGAEIAYWRRRAEWEEQRRKESEAREHGLIAEAAQLKGAVERMRQELAGYRRELAEERESLGAAIGSIRRRIADLSEETHLLRQRQVHDDLARRTSAPLALGLWNSVRHAAARFARKDRPISKAA